MASDPDVEVLRQRLDALVKDADATEAKAAATQRRVQAALLLLEEEQAAAVAAKGLLPAPSSSSATSDMVDGAACDSTLVSNLHVQATVVPNVHQLVNIVLDTTSSNYAIWLDLMMMAPTRYSLADHVLSDDAFPDDPAWTRMDAIVLCWLNNTLTPDLQEVARECGCPACHLWLTLENQLLGNRETRTLHLDATFRNFVQGDLSVTEYCHKFKGMVNALADLGSPVDDRILVLNILRGLNQRFEHLGAMNRCSSPFPNFLKVRDDLLLEEIHLDTVRPSAAPTVLYTSTAVRIDGPRGG
jgi:hypothetical protein